MQMTDQEIKEEMPQPEHFEQQEPVEQPVVVVQTTKTIPVKEKKTMLALEDRMKEFRDMMLERGVSVHITVRGFKGTLSLKIIFRITLKSQKTFKS